MVRRTGSAIGSAKGVCAKLAGTTWENLRHDG